MDLAKAIRENEKSLGGPDWSLSNRHDFERLGREAGDRELFIIYGRPETGESICPTPTPDMFRMIRDSGEKGNMDMEFFAVEPGKYGYDS